VFNEAKSSRRSDRRRWRREEFAAGAEATDQPTVSLEVRDAMSRLTMSERSVLYLAYWHDLTVEEISRTLNLSRRTTERALTTARRSLEEQLS
jgi:RNA polymerase sigma-70 factor (ECF subfamily)